MNRTTAGSTGRVDKMLLFKKKICIFPSSFALTYLLLHRAFTDLSGCFLYVRPEEGPALSVL